MGLQQGPEQGLLLRGCELSYGHDLRVHPLREAATLIEDEGHPTGHAGGHVATGAAQHHHHATGHVLAAVVAGALHHSFGTAIAHTKALTGTAQGEQLTTSGAIEAGIAQDYLVARVVDAGGRHNGEAATVEALAHIVVCFTHQAHIHALKHKGPETLTSGPQVGEIELALEAGIAMARRNFTGDAGAHAAIRVDDFHSAGQTAVAGNRAHHLGIGQQLVFQDLSIAVGLSVVLQPTAISSGGNRVNQAGEVKCAGFGESYGTGLQQFAASDQIFEPGHAKHA